MLLEYLMRMLVSHIDLGVQRGAWLWLVLRHQKSYLFFLAPDQGLQPLVEPSVPASIDTERRSQQ